MTSWCSTFSSKRQLFRELTFPVRNRERAFKRAKPYCQHLLTVCYMHQHFWNIFLISKNNLILSEVRANRETRPDKNCSMKGTGCCISILPAKLIFISQLKSQYQVPLLYHAIVFQGYLLYTYNCRKVANFFLCDLEVAKIAALKMQTSFHFSAIKSCEFILSPPSSTRIEQKKKYPSSITPIVQEGTQKIWGEKYIHFS